MKISIVTINRNNRDGLRRTLRSIAGQTAVGRPDVDVEHVVVDGESTDGSLDGLDSALGSIVRVCPPRGVYNAVNEGIKTTSGDIVGLLHAGDTYAGPEVLGRVLARFAESDAPDYVYGDVTIGRRYFKGDRLSRASVADGDVPPHPSLYMRRSAIEAVGLYDESYRNGADFEYFVRLAVNAALSGAYLPFVLVDMEPGGMSQSLRSRLVTNNVERVRALRKHGLPANPLRFFRHYVTALKGFVCSSKKQ